MVRKGISGIERRIKRQEFVHRHHLEIAQLIREEQAGDHTHKVNLFIKNVVIPELPYSPKTARCDIWHNIKWTYLSPHLQYLLTSRPMTKFDLLLHAGYTVETVSWLPMQPLAPDEHGKLIHAGKPRHYIANGYQLFISPALRKTLEEKAPSHKVTSLNYFL